MVEQQYFFKIGTETELRQKINRTVLVDIKELVMNPGFVLLPKSLAGSAIKYFLKNWIEATIFIEWGALPIDNTVDEQINKPFTIGRNNWIQVGSENGARWIAILYTMVTTCKLNNTNPELYLKEVLVLFTIRPIDANIADLLPINWCKKKNNATDPVHTPLYPSKKLSKPFVYPILERLPADATFFISFLAGAV